MMGSMRHFVTGRTDGTEGILKDQTVGPKSVHCSFKNNNYHSLTKMYWFVISLWSLPCGPCGPSAPSFPAGPAGPTAPSAPAGPKI